MGIGLLYKTLVLMLVVMTSMHKALAELAPATAITTTAHSCYLLPPVPFSEVTKSCKNPYPYDAAQQDSCAGALYKGSRFQGPLRSSIVERRMGFLFGSACDGSFIGSFPSVTSGFGRRFSASGPVGGGWCLNPSTSLGNPDQ